MKRLGFLRVLILAILALPVTVAAAAGDPLAGTTWQLVEFQSMDDAIGVLRPKNPAHFTMALSGDGSALLTLDCNSARGAWTAEPGPDGNSGRFALGPLAATAAICSPPDLGEKIVAQAAYVRSWLLKDGRLYLSLMADAGIQVWEPQNGVPFLTTADPELEAAILRTVPFYTRAIVDLAGGTGKGRYVHGRADLNDDGRDEVLVYLLGSIFCGTGGCNLLLFTRGQAGYTLVNDFPISRLPVIVAPRKTGDWHDLIRRESGGGAPPAYVRHVFDGNQYREQERLPGDAAPEGQHLLTGELSFDRGIPLEPRQ
jgi:hypothetical protein